MALGKESFEPLNTLILRCPRKRASKDA